MSIIDNDSNSSARNNPTLNVNDDGGVRKAHNTYGNTLRRVGSAVKQFLSFGQGTIEAKDADGNKSFFIGYDPALSTRPVIRVAKDGFDAQTGADSELIFNSEQNVLKIVSFGTTSVSSDDSATGGHIGSTTITHDLGFIPIVIAFVQSGGSWFPMPAAPAYSVSGTGTVFTQYIFIYSITSFNFVINFNNSAGGNATYNVKYYLLQETAN